MAHQWRNGARSEGYDPAAKLTFVAEKICGCLQSSTGADSRRESRAGRHQKPQSLQRSKRLKLISNQLSGAIRSADGVPANPLSWR
jgi:hypothetical protein